MLPLINAVPGLVWAYRIMPESGRAERAAGRLRAGGAEGRRGFRLAASQPGGCACRHCSKASPADEHPPAPHSTHETHATLAADDRLLFGTLVDFQREFDAATRDIGWLHFALSNRIIITTRLQPIRSIDPVRTSIEKNAARYARPMQIFEALVAEFQRGIMSTVLELTDELNIIEDIVYDSRAARRAAAAGTGPASGRPGCTGTCAPCSP